MKSFGSSTYMLNGNKRIDEEKKKILQDLPFGLWDVLILSEIYVYRLLSSPAFLPV